MLKAAAEAHTAWALAHADDVPYDEAAAKGHPDYAEHHADVSASPEIDDGLNSLYRDLIADLQSA